MSAQTALPFEHEDGILKITVFQGAVTTRVLPYAKRAFLFEITLRPRHPCVRDLPKPPEHFHPYQEEYVEVLQGALVVEVEGVERVLRPGDAALTVRRGANHRLYPPRLEADVPDTVRFLLSAEQIAHPFKLDLGFFENWYMYQEQLVVHGKKLDLLQVLSVSTPVP